MSTQPINGDLSSGTQWNNESSGPSHRGSQHH